MEPRYFPRYSSSRRVTMIDPDEESDDNSSAALPTISTRRRSTNSSSTSSVHSRPRPLHTPNKSIAPLHNLHPSAPASPPTPAPSPTPHQRAPSWHSAGEDEDTFLRDARQHFSLLGRAEGQRFLAEILNLCDNQQLSFVYHFVSPRLKKDPFKVLPNELCLRILSFIDDPKTLARASQVSIRWHELLNDDMTWKLLCDNHAYRTMSEDTQEDSEPFSFTLPPNPYDPRFAQRPWESNDDPSVSNNSIATTPTTSRAPSSLGNHPRKRRAKTKSYRSHFKQRYMVEAAWRKGGHVFTKHITPDHGVVTSLHLTSKYIAVALDNAKIHIFNTTGEHQRTLQGHVMGVWAMVPWDDILVSGGCDRDVRVWNMATGESIHKLRGHTSTVRCLKMSNATTAISGSRDTTLRIWDLAKGVCKNVLVGHQASVRCLGIHGDLVVSGSYDTTAKIWNISEGRCLRTLAGHFSQIYAIAFDGKRIATGSLDTSVRIWDPQTGQCHAILQGHTSLVGQLQMRGDTLVTGGSDGSVRVWSLLRMAAIHRLAAHDNSITSLQFDDNRIVSGGSDGRVKIWNLRTGQLMRELSQPAEAVWRVAFEDEKAVVMATRAGRTIMEVWSFAPPDDAFDDPGSDSDSQSSTAELGFSNSSSNTHHQFNDPHHRHHHRNDNTHTHASSSSLIEVESSSSSSSSSSSVAVISPPPAAATEPVPAASNNCIQDLEMQDAFTDVSSGTDANGR